MRILWRSVSLKRRVTYRIGVHSMPDTAFRGATKSRIRHSAFVWTCLNYAVPVFNRLTSSEISIYENWRKLLKRSRKLEKRTQRKKKTSPNNKCERWGIYWQEQREFMPRDSSVRKDNSTESQAVATIEKGFNLTMISCHQLARKSRNL